MRDPKIDLWAIDEVHFQQHGSRCRMWVPPEVSDPILLHHPTRKSFGYWGAVRLRDGKFIYHRETGRFNAETCLGFLKQLKKGACKEGRKAVIITDNARYHHAKLHRKWRSENFKKLRLDFLPAYSPELNPIERVWKLTRRMCLHNRYFPELEMVSASVESLFNTWLRKSDDLRRLCAIT
jgi:transposase